MELRNSCFIVLILFGVLFCDGQDTPPDLTYHVDEEKTEKKLLGYVGQDANLATEIGDNFQYLEYRLVNPQGILYVNHFSLNISTGALLMVSPLDRESECPSTPGATIVDCILTLSVAVQPSSFAISYFRSLRIAVYLDDVNDNSPIFGKKVEQLNITEGTPIGTQFSIVGAFDQDTGPNNFLKSYELSPESEMFSLRNETRLDGTSLVSIVVESLLDRETKDFYQLFVTAKDGGNPANIGLLTVNISVIDVNEFKPVFTQSQYNITVQENVTIATVVVRVSATDRDAGMNSAILYQFRSLESEQIRSLFSIDEASGEIRVIQQLENLPNTEYRMVIEAKDQGVPSLSSQAIVNVRILDTKNKKPSISLYILSGTEQAVISEYSNVGFPVAHITVTDVNTGRNGQVACTIRSDKFSLQSLAVNGREYKVIVKAKLNRETQFEHVVTVTCQDNGTPPLNDSKTFKVIISDENDNSPIFLQTNYTVSITENKPVGATILRVSAIDADEGINKQIRYSLIDPVHSKVSVDSTSGEVKTASVFDRETLQMLHFRVLAKDGGSPSFSATATVNLRITDENDNRPTFNQTHYTFFVEENQPQNTGVGHLSAYDRDEGKNGQFNFSLPYEPGKVIPFDISPGGVIKTNQELDREFQSHYDFTVVVTDQGVGQLKTSAQVTVNVADINDNSPQFFFPVDGNNSVTVSHLTEPDTVVGILLAEDPDEGRKGQISFSFVEGNAMKLFEVDENSGELILIKKIEMDEIGAYSAIVSAQDHGKTQRLTRENLYIIVKFDNTTAVAEVNPTGQNIMIAVSIACVTFVFSVVLIIAICILRRSDLQRRKYNASISEEQKIIGFHRENNMSSSSKGSHDIISHDVVILPDDGLQRKTNRKEVSFSLDEEQDHDTTNTTMTSGDGAPMKTFKHSQSTCPTQNIQSSSTNRDPGPLADEKQRELHRMASLRLQQALLQSQNRQWPSTHDDGRHFLGLKGHEDAQSESSGETTTSDSGRGGSEEDVRHSGASHQPESDDVRSTNSVPMSFSPMSDKFQLSNSSAAYPTFLTFQGKSNSIMQNPKLSSFQPSSSQRSNSDAGLRNNNLPVQCIDNRKVQRLQSDKIVPQLTCGSSQVDPHSKHMPDYDSNFYRTHKLSNLARSFDSESALGTTTHDDDNTTTTSGSYTIDADELHNEIDELFFKSDIVV